MKRRTIKMFLISVFLLPAIALADFESEVIDLVNAERTTQGLLPLVYDAQLTTAARDHSRDMGANDYFSHTSLDERSAGDRITDAGYDWRTYGENIAAGYPTPQAVMAGWMDSPGHRSNILNPGFCDIGVGYAHDAGSAYGHYWTQNFGCKTDAAPGSETGTILNSDAVSGENGGGGCFIGSALFRSGSSDAPF